MARLGGLEDVFRVWDAKDLRFRALLPNDRFRSAKGTGV